MQKRALPLLVLIAILGFGAYLRFPYLSTGLPYFYDEDEGHHFNRLINMVKTRDLNPHYFLKPSLHFYLRMPAVAIATYLEKRAGNLTSTEDIRTYDRYGLAKYAFSTSHPRIAIWSRAVSFALSLLIILTIYGIARLVSESEEVGLFASLITATAPPLVEHSCVIGVDTLMASMVCLGVYFALRYFRSPSLGKLLTCALFCGLAVSSKYNAAPVAALPLLTAYLVGERRLSILALAAISPVAAFLAATPYLIISFPLFFQHVSYEVWHYRVAGHTGHTAEPGIPQALFYLSWFGREALGWLAVAFAFIGALLLGVKKEKRFIVLFFFPFFFALLMVFQRANFTRNMLVLIPFGALFAAACALRIRYAGFIIGTLLLIQPLIRTLEQRVLVASRTESRLILEGALREYASQRKEIAVSGALQLSARTLRIPGVTVFDPSNFDSFNLYNHGFDLVVLSAPFPPASSPEAPIQADPVLQEVRYFPGNIDDKRVIDSPAIRIYALKPAESYSLQQIMKTDGFDLFSTTEALPCIHAPETHCWINTRLTKLTSPKNIFKTLSLTVMSPWSKQNVTLSRGNWKQEETIPEGSEGKWVTLNFSLPVGAPTDPLVLRISKIHSPKEMMMGDDARRLGLAVKAVALR